MYKNLRKLREEKGFSCRKMGLILGYSKSNYNKKERGEVPFSLKEAQKIAVLLGETIETIFKTST